MRSYFLAHLPASWGWIVVPSYMALLTLAILLSCIWISRRAAKSGLRGSWVSSAMLISAVAAFLGARVLCMIEQPPENWKAWLQLYDITEGGFSLAGGAIGASFAAWLYLRFKRLPANDLADAAAPPMGLALALARLGCFMGGCEFGLPSSLPWAVSFPADSWAFRKHAAARLIVDNASVSLAVHPLQLYEAVLGMGLMMFALYWTPRRRFSGQVYLLVVLIYCFGRFGFDFLRDPFMTAKWGQLLSSQWLALAGIVVSAALYLHFCRSHES